MKGGGTDNVGKTNTLRIEVGQRQNTLLGETAPPTSQFVRFLLIMIFNFDFELSVSTFNFNFQF